MSSTETEKQLLFSVTASDCEWSYTRGTGSGGQKRNKTSSAVHCSHRPSGAHGYCEESRSQLDNKRTAFQRMSETKEFKRWHEMEVMKRLGIQSQIEERVEREMRRVRVEVKSDGKWIEVDKNDPLDLNTPREE